MKYCYNCKTDLPLEMFGKNKSKPTSLADECKICKSKLSKIYRDKNKDKLKNKSHEYYSKNHEVMRKNACKYAKENVLKKRVWGTRAKNKLKSEVFAYYSGIVKCNHCNETEIGVLSIDHIAGNGSQHRKEILGGRTIGGYNFYSWLKKNNYPEGFQVLCFNCQYRKRMIEMQPKNPTEKQLRTKNRVRLLKEECLSHYGGLVCPCGESDITTLTLDHINDDGNKHREETGTKGYGFYCWLKKNKFPKDVPLQTLCINCNIRKRNKKYKEMITNNATDYLLTKTNR